MLESSWIPLAADAAVAALLVATLVYVVRLNGRLAALRADRGALAELIQGLQKASQQAEAAVAGLRLSANDSGRKLDAVMERAGALKDDLTFLIGKAESAADRLEVSVRGRAEPAPAGAPEPASAAPGNRLAALLRQSMQAERAEPAFRSTEAEPDPIGAVARQSRSERELQRALLGRS